MKEIKILLRVSLVSVLMMIFIFGCSRSNGDKAFVMKDAKAPQTVKVTADNFDAVLYVSKEGNDAEGNGSKDAPYSSIKKAVANSVEDKSTALFIAAGRYAEFNIKLKNGVSLFGGFDSENWSRDILKNETVIAAEGKGRVIIAADNLTIDGFTITEGKFRGLGGAIFFNNASPKISNNIFTKNISLKPIPWNPKYWHETANDGGAVYFENGCNPVIENNYFVNNKTENGRGGALACNNNCKPVISGNVFYNNIAGLDDPMRSSDGGAISIFDWCDAKIEGNVIVSNTAQSHNDAGGVFVALWSSAQIENNLFVDNEAGDDAGALFVGGQEHRYDGPLDPIPSKDKFYVAIKNNAFIGNRNSSRNSGTMRFTMESRGEFVNNITALNNGVYFQRSEVKVAGNTILDNFLFIETKEGLELGSIEDNIIWGDYSRTVEAAVKNNNMKFPEEGNGNYYKPISFVDDGINIAVLSANWMRSNNTTNIITNQKFVKNELVNRVVKVNDNLAVVKSNDEDSITIWGNFSEVTNVGILPTYTLESN